MRAEENARIEEAEGECQAKEETELATQIPTRYGRFTLCLKGFEYSALP